VYQDYKDLLSAFHSHGVKYLIVGGYAVSFHSQPRATKDLDLFIQADSANARAAYDALATFGAPLQGIEIEDLVDRRGFLRFGVEPVGIDILPEIPGLRFEDAWLRRVESVLDAETDLKAFYVSRDDLIAAKLASGRLRDLADVEAIREAARTFEAPIVKTETDGSDGEG
jgi:hypothetical protein